MPTLTGIYDQLATGATAPVALAFEEPSTAPTSGTGRTLNQIAALLPAADNINGATASQVLFGRTFWGLRTDGTWGPNLGTALAGTNVVGGDGLLTFSIPDALYSGRTATASDSDLVTGNIRAGVNLFGVVGKTEVVDTALGGTAATAAELVAGKQAFVNGILLSGIAAAGSDVIGTNGLLTFSIPNGIYFGRTASASDTDLITGNIRAGVNLFGVAGKTEVVDTTLGGTAAAPAELAAGRQAFVNGAPLTGTAAAGANVVGGNGVLSFPIPDGFYSARIATASDTDLVTGNVRAGTNIFGVAGKTEVVDTTLAASAASATDLVSGKQGFVNGTLVSGTIVAGANVSGGDGVLTFSIPDGLYSARTATASDTDLVTGNIRAGVNLFGVAGKTEVVDTTLGGTAAVAADIVSGKEAYVNGSVVSGTVAAGGNVVGANGLLSFPIPDGIYSARTATAIDANLLTGNIRAGVTLFGISGKPEVVDTTLAGTAASASQISNGRQAWVNGALVSGALSGGGLTCSGTFVGTRWCDQGNGTILDMSSGLVWVKDASCLGSINWDSAVVQTTNTIANGVCGLTDGSSVGDWRLPLTQELRGLSQGTDPVTCTDQAFINLTNTAPVWTLNSLSGASVVLATVVFLDCIPSTSAQFKATDTAQVMAVKRK
jgi:hypothetical protein